MYTIGKVEEKMEGNLGLLAGELGLQKVKVLEDLYRDPENSGTQASIDDYFTFRTSDYGWTVPDLIDDYYSFRTADYM